jgi:hypothetical protein
MIAPTWWGSGPWYLRVPGTSVDLPPPLGWVLLGSGEGITDDATEQGCQGNHDFNGAERVIRNPDCC